MAILFALEDVSFPSVLKPVLRSWIVEVAAVHGFKVGRLGYLLCTDDRILQINRAFLNHDYYTDIITFDYSTDSTIHGDIYISMDTVGSNAEQFGVGLENEFCRIVIHGVLHLCGFPDKEPEERRRMTQLEDEALQLLFAKEGWAVSV